MSSYDVKQAMLLGLELDRGLTHAHSPEHSTSPSSSNTAWFGPRLGRRKRSVVLDDELFENLDDGNRKNSNNVEDDAQIIRHFPSSMPVIIRGKCNVARFAFA